jgi:hypothetical protein
MEGLFPGTHNIVAAIAKVKHNRQSALLPESPDAGGVPADWKARLRLLREDAGPRRPADQ